MVCGGRHPLVDLLCVLFGIGAWVAVNGIWVELPLLVELPEQWALPSYLSVIIQIANIGPLAYSASKLTCNNIKPSVFIYAVLMIGCLASFFLAWFWDRTTIIGGSPHSTALFILVFFLALVDCTSSVLYLPYMGTWKNIYLPTYSVGEGLSGLLPALVALAQGVGSEDDNNVSEGSTVTYLLPLNGSEHGRGLQWFNSTYEIYLETNETETYTGSNPNFSVSVFFFILFAMMVASTIAFTLLDLLPFIRSEKSDQPITGRVRIARYSSTDCIPSNPQLTKEGPSISNNQATDTTDNESSQSAEVRTITTTHQYQTTHWTESTNALLVDDDSFRWPTNTLLLLLFGQLFASMLMNGFLPSIQSYSSAPYGTTAYHLAATLSAFANPCAAFITACVKRVQPATLAILTALGTLFAAYIVTMAAMSPSPLLVDTDLGTALVVSAWISFTFLMSFVRVEINNLLRLTGGGAAGGKVLFWSGAATQSGSCIGAIAAFVLVNVAKVFKS